MFSYEVVGYAFDGAAYCTEHTPSKECPIFAGDEGEYHCDTCLDQIIAETEGWQRQKRAQDALLDTAGKGQGARYAREQRKRARHASRLPRAIGRAKNTLRHSRTNLKPLREARGFLVKESQGLLVEINETQASIEKLRHEIAAYQTYIPNRYMLESAERKRKLLEQMITRVMGFNLDHKEVSKQLKKVSSKLLRLHAEIAAAEFFLATHCDPVEPTWGESC